MTDDTPAQEELTKLAKKWDKKFSQLFFVVIFVWAGWFARSYFYWNEGGDTSSNLARFGQFGDSFGALNTFFTGAAFLGVVYTIYFQHVEAKRTEARRRTDKKDEDNARKEADRRHSNELQSQERIAKIQALTACLSFEEGRHKRSEQMFERLGKMQHFFTTVFDDYRNNDNDTLNSFSIRGGEEFRVNVYLELGDDIGDLKFSEAHKRISKALKSRTNEEIAELGKRMANIEKLRNEIVELAGTTLAN